MMYAKSRDQIREWIHDGSTETKRGSETWRRERARGTLRMPAFGRRFRAGQIEDLVSFVQAMALEPEPDDSLAVLYSETACGVLCGGGGYFVFKREAGGWKLIAYHEKWVS